MIALPLLLLILAGIGWSGAWFYAAGRAEREIDAWIAREATQGRAWSCGQRSLGGFPFRFELLCDAPRLDFAGAGGWEATAGRAHAVAQVWDPGHIIVEFQSPARLAEAAGGQVYEASWTLLQSSGVGTGGRPDRISTAADNLEIRAAGAPASLLFAARHVEVHARRHPDAAEGTLDLAALLRGARGPAATGSASAVPVDGELQATITAMPEARSMPTEQRLRLWQEAGGRAKLALGRISAGDAASLTTTADVGLDSSGRLDGEANMSAVGIDRLSAALTAAGLMPPALAALAPMARAAGTPAEVNGQRAASFAFTLKRGRISLGLLPLGSIGPLF
ncbi:MAG TPA: DUF2125 domain-containing protein [Xanthobacteraceae bacterium]|nr:DUF2125 domain-containing protein [Xanthobacteraceae bacterium]